MARFGKKDEPSMLHEYAFWVLNMPLRDILNVYAGNKENNCICKHFEADHNFGSTCAHIFEGLVFGVSSVSFSFAEIGL